MITVGTAAKRFGISRTTLLYYEQIGLVCPLKRADNGYRLFSDEDMQRLKVIMNLRDAGIALKDISKYLENRVSDVSSLLIKRLSDLNSQIKSIKEQQAVIVKLIGSQDLKSKRVNKDVWNRILKEAGVDNETTFKWHASFEKQSPEQHTNLLHTLGFSDEEIIAFKKEYTQD
jgi:DNA-binding transcriptional MerR regulator